MELTEIYWEGIQKQMAKVIRTKKQRKTESICETLYLFWGYLLDLTVCVYMLLILVGLPFYNEEGFTHIGTDKAMFFRNVALKCGRIVLPVLVIFLIFKMVLFVQQAMGDGKKVNAERTGFLTVIKHFGFAVKDYCKTEMSVTDYFALAYGVVVVFSYHFSGYQDEALWGTTGWYMGTLPQLILVISYFMISRAWTRRNWMLLLVLPVSAAVFVLGILNRFGYFPIDMQVENASFVSTIGNVNWYCGYLVSVFFGGLFLLWKQDWEKLWQKLLLIAYVLIGFATLVTHGSSSGVVTMGVMILVLFCLSVTDGKRMEAFWLEMCILSVASLVIYVLCHKQVIIASLKEESILLFTNTKISILMTVVSVLGYVFIKFSNYKVCYPKRFLRVLSKLMCGGILMVLIGYLVVVFMNTKSEGALLAATALSDSRMFKFSPAWGSNRGATWAAGAFCFWEQDFLHKLIGVGPDCMAAFIYNGASEDLLTRVKATFPASRLTNAHNEWLTMLVQVGLLGFISYVGMIVSAIKRYIGKRECSIVVGACGCCVLAYTINNMFSFQQSMGAATIFIVLAVGENYLRNSKSSSRD